MYVDGTGAVDVRNDAWGGLFRILEGLGIAALGFVTFWGGSSFVTDTGAHRYGFAAFLTVSALAGFGLAACGVCRLVDRRVKLPLIAEGLKDCRTGILVRWDDILGVRLEERRTYGGLMAATLHVEVRNSGEVAFDVYRLDRRPGEIGRLVRERWGG